jgi:PAS domain S-box-containing protein
MWWVEDVNRGIFASLKDSKKEIIYHFEYLDFKSSIGKIYTKDLYKLLKTKYAERKYDAIIIVDNNSLDFIRKHKDLYFQDIPKIFCGINFFKPELLLGIKNITGVSQGLGIRNTIKLILKLQPRKKKLLVISDYTLTSSLIRKDIQSIEKEFSAAIKFEYFSKFSFKSLSNKVKNLNDDYVVYMTIVNRDSLNMYLRDTETAKLVSFNSSVPVYTNFSEIIKNGAVGGYISSGYDQGFEAGKMIHQILEGANIKNIGIKHLDAEDLKIDYLSLIKYKIPIEELPPYAIIKNKPDSIWDNFFKKHIIPLSILFLLIIISIYFYFKQKKIRNHLEEDNNKLKIIVGDKSKEIIKAIKEIETIFNSNGIGIMKTMPGKVIKANKKASDILGYEHEELLNSQPESVFLDNESYKNFIINHKSSYDSTIFEFPFKKKNGEKIWLFVSHSKCTETESVWFFDDITRKKEMEQIKEDIERMMRHDLKTPLNGIIGFGQLIKKSKKLKGEHLTNLEHIDKCAKNILNMINSSLDLYKLETGNYPIKHSEFDIIETVKLVISDLNNSAKIKGITTNINYNSEKLVDDEKILLFSDFLLIYSLLANILKNAYEASPEHEEVIVNINDKNNLSISILNTGAIPTKIRDSFFDKYSTSGKFNGTGLGTYSARLMCEVLGGSIKFKIIDEKQTKIIMDFPNIDCFSNSKYNMEDIL